MNAPYGARAAYASPQSGRGMDNLTMMDWILPPPALPLILILLVVLPLGLLSAQSLLMPLFEALSALMVGGGENLAPSLPWYFYVKLAVFFVLGFFGLLQLFLRINAYYYAVWSKGFPQPHSLHVAYQPDSQGSMIALLNWKMYRLFAVLAPPVALGLLTAFVGIVELYVFNLSTGFPFISLSIQFIIALFLLMLFSLFTGLAVLNSLWTYFTTVFGDIVAVTEPELPAKSIFDRCGRIAFGSPMIWIFYITYGIFLAGVLVEVYTLLSHYTVYDLITFKANVPLVLGLEGLTFVFYISINYLRFYAYHHSLVNYYNRLPIYLKDRYAFKV